MSEETQQQQQPFTALECTRTMTRESQAWFVSGVTYPITAVFDRGNHIIDGQPFYFAQTTFQVTNSLGVESYVPFSSTDYFIKKRSSSALQDSPMVHRQL